MVARERSESAPMNTTSVDRPSDRELVTARTFNGPARIVFDAWTKPELVRRWWAPQALGASIVSCDADVRVGGRYRYVLLPRNGQAFAFSGRYRDVAPHSRLVYTSFFEPTAAGAPEDDADAVIVTVTFDEQDGQTRLVAR
jgi:uncharacterized protein YndB with AHSA1/START domain